MNSPGVTQHGSAHEAQAYDELLLAGGDVYLEEEINVDDVAHFDTAHAKPLPQSSAHSHSSASYPRIYRMDKENTYAAGTSKEYKVPPNPSLQKDVHRVAYEQSLTVGKSRSKKRGSAYGAKKPCNCTKSMCLKLYCDCFANGEFCRDCNCKDCHNNMEHEAERTRAVKQSLERNPNAFKPKIALIGHGANKGRTEAERLHQKGCHCKKSSCLKNYCECYEAKVACTERCKCTGCRNTESDRIAKAQLPMMRETRSVPSGLLSTSSASGSASQLTNPQASDEDSDGEERGDPKTLPWFYMTDDVIEATTMCLVAQAEEVEANGGTDETLERCILNEFASCIRQIIDNATQCAIEIPNREPQ